MSKRFFFKVVMLHIKLKGMERRVKFAVHFTLRKFHTVDIWYQFLTVREKLVPILHVFHTNISHFVKNAHVVKLYVAYMRILHPPKKKKKKKICCIFAFDSNSSHAWHHFIIGAVLTGYR